MGSACYPRQDFARQWTYAPQLANITSSRTPPTSRCLGATSVSCQTLAKKSWYRDKRATNYIMKKRLNWPSDHLKQRYRRQALITRMLLEAICFAHIITHGPTTTFFVALQHLLTILLFRYLTSDPGWRTQEPPLHPPFSMLIWRDRFFNLLPRTAAPSNIEYGGGRWPNWG